MFKGFFKGVSRVSPACFKGVSNMFQTCLKGASRMFHGCFKAALRFQRFFKEIPRSSNEASRVFQENFSEISHCLVGSKAYN